MVSRSFRRSLVCALVAGTVVVPSALADTSQNVALIPGPNGAAYDGVHGAPPFPTDDAQLAAFHFGSVGFGQITSQLAGYDTAILYGVRWDDVRISAADRAALNAYAQTHKLIIWDADSTTTTSSPKVGRPDVREPSSFADFLYPFGEVASGENRESGGAVSIVTAIAGNLLASSEPSSPLYIDTAALSKERHAVGDSSVMYGLQPDVWQVSLRASNQRLIDALTAKGQPIIADGFPLVAWAYGSTAQHTGMVIYSGIGADALNSADTPRDGSRVNWARRVLLNQLKAPFRTTPETGCAPSCPAPPVDTPTITGGTPFAGDVSAAAAATTVTATTGTTVTTAASCGLSAVAPRGWVHGGVALAIRGVATAGHVTLTTPKGLTVASAAGRAGLFNVRLDTHRLASGRTTTLTATSLVGTTRQCAVNVLLRVDNVAPKALRLVVTKAHAFRTVSFRASEAVQARLVIKGRKTRVLRVAAGKKASFRVLHAAQARLVLVDRAHNSSTRLLKLA
jgi:hypothetical protein